MVKIRVQSAANAGILLGLLIQLGSVIFYVKYRSAIENLKQEVLSNLERKTQIWNDYGVVMDSESSLDNSNELKRDAFDVTLVTQCSVNNMHHLIETLHRWTGPISVSVFAPGEHFSNAKMGAKSISSCFPTRDIKFYLVYSLNKPPIISETELKKWFDFYSMVNITARCSRLLDTLRAIAGYNYVHDGIAYPHNTLRNVARKGVRTTHMFLLDVDVMPSYSVRKSVLQVLRNSAANDDVGSSNHQAVYVTPVFEIGINATMPITKQEIKEAIKTDEARIFHAKTCPMCHKPTK